MHVLGCSNSLYDPSIYQILLLIVIHSNHQISLQRFPPLSEGQTFQCYSVFRFYLADSVFVLTCLKVDHMPVNHLLRLWSLLDLFGASGLLGLLVFFGARSLRHRRGLIYRRSHEGAFTSPYLLNLDLDRRWCMFEIRNDKELRIVVFSGRLAGAVDCIDSPGLLRTWNWFMCNLENGSS